MKSDENLTIEKISNKFDSQFDMVNHAINLVVNMIHSGRGPRVKISSQNTASQVLAEIVEGKDHLEEIVERDHSDMHSTHQAQNIKGYSTFKTSGHQQ
ncbi:MAG: hypothetical protein VX777_05470 [Chlamydiota bacterium]|nr:hypothetical protein [Chlamydiota bacterium]